MTDAATLRPYGREHDAATVRWLDSGELRATFGFSGAITVESHRRWVDASKNTHIWAILDAQGTHCGNTLLHVNNRHRSAYFQMYIGEAPARGRGVGEAALRLTMAHAFERLGLHRVWLHTFATNLAAEALYRKTGFVLEGVERDAILTEGRFISQNRWSLLADEWHRLRERAAA
jgi:RimJ/RimL family protein N-acetyltransferase